MATLASILKGFADAVGAAEAAKGAEETPLRKAVRGVRSALNTVNAEGVDKADVPEGLVESMQGFVDQHAAEVGFDRTEGDKVAASLKALMQVDPDLRPAGFEEDVVKSLLERWSNTGRGRRAGSNGPSTTPESQKLPVPVKVTFTLPEGAVDKLSESGDEAMPATHTIQHASTWSSVSNEISKVARKLDGVPANAGYKRPADAKTAWQAARKSIIDGGPGGVVTVPTSQGDLVANVEAVR